MSLKQLQITHLNDRRLNRVVPELVLAFDEAVNHPYRSEAYAPCFYHGLQSEPLGDLIKEYANTVELAPSYAMDAERQQIFKSLALTYNRRAKNPGRKIPALFATLLRLASCVPDQHPGQKCLLDIFETVLNTPNTRLMSGQVPDQFKDALEDHWALGPWSTSHTSMDLKTFRHDEWVNFNAFIAMMCQELDSDQNVHLRGFVRFVDLSGFAFRGMGLALINCYDEIVESEDRCQIADLRGLTASRWAGYCCNHLVIAAHSSRPVFTARTGYLWPLDQHTWAKMAQNLMTTIGEIGTPWIYEASVNTGVWMVGIMPTIPWPGQNMGL
ncbi:hypothetical protein X797_010996 [Metarhizium robertsii]|uniref:Uncharacterized protein n=2 Tax=Metarhizium robertsii TaxID=568076 RepID=A0A0B2XGV8_METRA|nr:uncharacterized protein MAA_11638 [Metarhizium robertsii ARSEF 23]EXU95936.1 hypothetical protein X797_010996 [Metarhizium robertsii]KHO10792.1 hypothetical protein MAA_11638 [Metarhizium robertsii ARSEF 23]